MTKSDENWHSVVDSCSSAALDEAFEGHGRAVLTAVHDSLSIPLFICDRNGSVRNLTQAASALIRSERGLQLRDGYLRTSRSTDARALTEAIESAALATRTIIVRAEKYEAAPLVLDVFAMPGQRGPNVLIVVRGPKRDDASKAALLECAYGLTSAESQVALLAAEGKVAEAIATSRGVAVGTVRAQIKSILVKMGVSRQVELVARLAQL